LGFRVLGFRVCGVGVDTLQTTAGEEIVAEKEPFYEEYNISSQEVERMLIDVAELERQKAEL